MWKLRKDEQVQQDSHFWPFASRQHHSSIMKMIVSNLKCFIILYPSIDILHIVLGFVAYYAKHMHFSIF